MRQDKSPIDRVKDFWEAGSCGEVYASGLSARDYYDSQSHARYALEPYLAGFARFSEGHGRDVLEVGVGMGADHVEWARSGPRTLTGIDLTPRAVEHTKARLKLYDLVSKVVVGDAEHLPFDSESFDLVYSWGVLHHSPNTPQAISEVHRVLRPGGIARIMIYHRYSLVGYILWARYALLTGHPFRSLGEVYASHLESPGTKAYSLREAQTMFREFSRVSTTTQLTFGDLLQGAVGQRHQGPMLRIAKRLWPRPLLETALNGHGLALLVEARK
jgi:ubiquinone/menaquinone biosynthesis C-methylase UbiE